MPFSNPICYSYSHYSSPPEYSKENFRKELNDKIEKICSRRVYYYCLFCDPDDIHRKARKLQADLLPLIEEDDLEAIVKFVNDRHEDVSREISEDLSMILCRYRDQASNLLAKQEGQSVQLKII